MMVLLVRYLICMILFSYILIYVTRMSCNILKLKCIVKETVQHVMKDFDHPQSLYPPQNEVLGGYTVFSLSVIP